MKIKLTPNQIYSLIYYSISIAQFKHTSWTYSTVMEGAEPIIDWAVFVVGPEGLWQLSVVLFWYIPGMLAAFAIDIGMYLLAKNIREEEHQNMLGAWMGLLFVAAISAYGQVMYSIQHAALFVPVSDVPQFVNDLYVWRYLLLPTSLPVLAIIYTAGVKVRQVVNRKTIGSFEPETGRKRFTVDEAASHTGYSASAVRGFAMSGKLQRHKDEAGKLFFYESELQPFKRN